MPPGPPPPASSCGSSRSRRVRWPKRWVRRWSSASMRARQPSAAARAAPARPLAILCAEENPYGRVVMNTILCELGHRVDFVETGEAVVKAAERGGYDAVLMVITLSGLDGIEATGRIRA